MKDVLDELAAARRAMGTGRLPAGDAYTVELRRRYDAHVDDVWDAITSPERLSRWLKPVSGICGSAGCSNSTVASTARSSDASRRVC
ncbi:hypothetical protein [Mycolicibacterium sediminis]|uniref:Polyketide cyclase n=1 Tax=Mycolicibacterium sediminis TaxID=1286180 RepID=A0A7I7QN29_9MYCO|nr:hypothetical protein [Mycolicibacterium sediminis]BBY27226.1 hypothetical protein MSEDJ_13220 [Mycolicibacterium sediminis]